VSRFLGFGLVDDSLLLALGVNGSMLDSSVDLVLEVMLSVLVRFRGVVDNLLLFLGMGGGLLDGLVNLLLKLVFGVLLGVVLLLSVMLLHGRLFSFLLGVVSFVNGFLGFGDRLLSLLDNLNGLLLGDFALLLVSDSLVGFLDCFMSLFDVFLLLLDGLLSLGVSNFLDILLGGMLGSGLLVRFLSRLGFLNLFLSFLDIFLGLLNDLLSLSLRDKSLLLELLDLLEVFFSGNNFLSSLLLNFLGVGGFENLYLFGDLLCFSLLSGNLGVDSVVDEVLNLLLLDSSLRFSGKVINDVDSGSRGDEDSEGKELH